MDEELEAAKERSWREVAALDEAYARGELADEAWHAATAALVVPAYLAAESAEGGSGSSRGAAGWERARSLLSEAVASGQTFLDIGCANGHLMECMARWGGVEPYGVDIAPELARLARSRPPQWKDRIWEGNALHWRPRRRFDVVRTNVDYVPPRRRPQLLRHVLSYTERLIVGVFNEERDAWALEQEVAAWGFEIAGRTERLHPHPRLAYRAFWIDAG